MALVKTDYGLIYNDDGSLCVTVRDDDIPFKGVKSFAVEEGTTNLLSGTPTSEYYGIKNQKGYEFTFTANSDNTVPHYLRFLLGNVITKPGIQLSFYLKKTSTASQIRFNLGTNEGGNTNYFWGEFVLTSETLQNVMQGGVRASVRDAGDYWYITIGSDTVDTSKSSYFVDFVMLPTDINKTLIIKNVQLEEKKFPTSFVDGSRNTGRFGIKLQQKSENMIFLFMTKMLTSSAGKMLFSFEPEDGWGSAVGVDGLWLGPYESNVIKIRSHHTDGSYYTLSTGIDGTTLVGKWILVAIILNGTSLILKIKGEDLDYSGTLIMPSSFSSGTADTMYFGTWRDVNSDFFSLLSARFSNIYIGNYDPTVWTDAYIQELYNAKRPFSVPAKLPII
ncbi:phage head spike fiber domain-containing protein [Marinitoga sp. 1155]|uniref:phage head spike fiber domain-containing protein n=1 Tax=Marinitoga sp. 1155 TaxID=1428448 RepID=UPI0006414CA9|nr:hypothetical protein [Marinitoga sp. 1155]AJW77004.1 hypothetical protein UF09_38 [Marinitoga camini virus 2]KLO24824.1 hypothetical protein X274_02455 [Marinitoga sp. 1155]